MRLRTKIYNLIISNKTGIVRLSPDFMYRLEKLYFSEANRVHRIFLFRDPSYNKELATEHFREELGHAINKLGNEINIIYRLQLLIRCFCKQVFIPQISILEIETVNRNIKNKLKIYKELVR